MATAQGHPVDLEELDQRIAQVNILMRTHAGAIELESVSEDGVVTVRFVAMCQGCPFRAVTMFGFVIPALSRLKGVTEVRAVGVRVSEEAARRAALAMEGNLGWPLDENGEDYSDF